MDKRDDLKYCPTCGAEYREDAVQCADCEVDLVFGKDLDELPALPGQKGDIADDGFVVEQFVIGARDINEIQKDLIVSSLTEAGIPHYISGDQFSTVQMYWSLESKIWVPRKLAVQAAEIINALLEEVPSSPDDEDENDDES